MARQRHLLQQQSELEANYQLLNERIYRLRAEIIAETHPDRKFQYEQSLAQLEAERHSIDGKLEALEHELLQAAPPTQSVPPPNNDADFRNPYQISRAVDDPGVFAGRETVLRQVFHMLLTQQTISIVGARRIGKTSLLNMIQSPIKRHQIMSGHAGELDPACFVRFDMQGGLDATPLDLLQRMATEINAAGVKMPDTVAGYGDFEDGLRELKAVDRHLIILWDEFDQIARNPHFDLGFFNKMRYFQQTYPVSYIIASSSSLQRLCRQSVLASPFFNVAMIQTLKLFTSKSARQLIGLDPRLNDEADFVLHVAGRHPFFIALLCFYLCDLLFYGDDLDIEEIREQALDNFLHNAVPHFLYYWEHLTVDERSVLVELAGDQTVDDSYTTEIDHLLDKALLVKGKDGRYDLFSAAFQAFVSHIPSDKIEADIDEIATKYGRQFQAFARQCLKTFADFHADKE